MSNIRVIYEDAEGVKVMQPTDNGLKERSLEEIIDRSIPDDVFYVITDISQLPASREFRGAWHLKNNKIEHDLEKAKAIQLDRLRQARDRALVEMDGEQMKLQSLDESIDPIKDKKNRLRNVTDPIKELDTNTCSLDDIRALGNPDQIKEILGA